MDQDEFSDFQTSATQSQPRLTQPESDIPHLFHHSQSQVYPTVDLQTITKVQPSCSLDMNTPSQQDYEYESTDWESSAQPNLGKMESDQVGAVEQLAPDFSKRNSQGDASGELSHSPRQQFFNNEHEEVKQNYSNSATLHSNLFQDFDFGLSSKPHHEPSNHSPESLPEKNEPISPRKVEHEHSECRQIEISQDENRLDKKQDEEEDKFNDYGTAEAGKQSQDFEYQEAAQPQHQNPTNQSRKQVVQTQNDYHSEPDHNQIEEKQMAKPDEQFVQYRVSQHAQDFLSYNYGHQSPVNKQEQELIQEQDDQFGDFEETVQTVEENHINSLSNPRKMEQNSEVVHTYQEATNRSNQVKIDANKAPYDMEVPSRQEQLQRFVDNLPNYDFLLTKAFNTL